MKHYRLNRKHTLLLIGVIFVTVTSGIIYFNSTTKGGTLSAEQLDEKFDCSRITADVRPTDAFCGDPDFYNNPDSVTYEEFYDLQGCAKRLQNLPPLESQKETAPGFYNAYYECKDSVKMEKQHQDFIKNLKVLKINNS